MRILNLCVVYKFQTVNPGVRYPSHMPDRLLFYETFAQPCIFAVVNCADVALSAFCYSSVLTRCWIFWQLSTALSLDAGDNLC